MITVIAGTNRPNSRTKLLAEYCFKKIKEHSEGTNWIDLAEIQNDLFNDKMYDKDSMSPNLMKIQDDKFNPSKTIVVFLPEYNGGVPGIFKLFIDALSIRRYQETFAGKKAVLVGLASGRGGNLRGLEYATGFLNYLGIHVYPKKYCISQIEDLFSEDTMSKKLIEELAAVINSALEF